MSLDTPATESNASLSVRDAAALFDAPAPEQAQPETQVEEPAKVEPETAPEATQADPETEKVEEPDQPSDETITIEVDGKAVEVKKSELPDLYKNGLRQADYTKKTMEAAELRKAAEAEATKAREERQQYAQGLQQAQALLQAQLAEQGQIDWQKLLETDPVEYMKQDRIARERQARLQQIHQEQQQLHARHQAEQAEQMKSHIRTQQEELLAKLPDWKDEGKAKAEKAQLREYLLSQGFDAGAVDNVADHRTVLLSRKAMLYDQMMSKAQAAAKKVESLPQRVERPGGGDTNPLDGRTAAMKQLAKSGSVRDAAAVFDRMFS